MTPQTPEYDLGGIDPDDPFAAILGPQKGGEETDPLDFTGAFDDAVEAGRIEVRDPHDPAWGYKPSRWTKSQEDVWRYYWEADRIYALFREATAPYGELRDEGREVYDVETGALVWTTPSPGDTYEAEGQTWTCEFEHTGLVEIKAAMIGGKGSGKTFLFAMIAAKLVQKYPGSIGMLCSNTFPQLQKSLVPHFLTVMRSLGFGPDRLTYHTQATIDGRPFERVFVVHLTETIKSFVVMTSFANIVTIEGSEWDWQLYTELQDSSRENFAEVGITRCRGTRANRGIGVDAMPENADHWQYETLEAEFGFFLREPSVYENVKNVGMDYIRGLLRSYDPIKAEGYVHGRRVSISGGTVFPSFDYETHVGRDDGLNGGLCRYDPNRKVLVTFDFNVFPMCASAWQLKPCPETLAPDGWDLDADPYDVLCQIDEWEVFEGGTPVVVEQIVDAYGPEGLDHKRGGYVLGDAAGNHRNTIDPGKTDWTVIRNGFRPMLGMRIVPGLVRRWDGKKATFSNPPKRDQVNRANTLLRDASGRVRVLFLPASKFASGGAARSVGRLKRDARGEIDSTPDRDPSHKATRTHFADGFMYVAYHVTGGEKGVTLGRQKKALARATATETREFGDPTLTPQAVARRMGWGASSPSRFRTSGGFTRGRGSGSGKFSTFYRP